MKLRDDKALFREVLALIQSAADGNDTTPYITVRVLDAVDHALAAPSPETGTAAVPRPGARICVHSNYESSCVACGAFDNPPQVPAPAPEPAKPPSPGTGGGPTVHARPPGPCSCGAAQWCSGAVFTPAATTAEPVKPPATCICFHAPEQHNATRGCGVFTLMNGPCPCKYDGERILGETA